jgi:hypothetical protein
MTPNDNSNRYREKLKQCQMFDDQSFHTRRTRLPKCGLFFMDFHCNHMCSSKIKLRVWKFVSIYLHSPKVAALASYMEYTDSISFVPRKSKNCVHMARKYFYRVPHNRFTK